MKRLILGILILILPVLASAEITFILKDGSKVTWENYTETQTHYCKRGTTYCIDKADVDAIREVVGGGKKSSSQMVDDYSLKSKEYDMKKWEDDKKKEEEVKSKLKPLNLKTAISIKEMV